MTFPNMRGAPLEEADYQALEARAIDRDTADTQPIRRVNSLEGAEIVGRNGRGNWAGLIIGYTWPNEDRIREWRLRRDHPEYENGKPKGKYLAPPGRGNLLFIPAGVEAAWLADATIEAVIVEGEFKCLSLFTAAWHNLGEAAELPRYVPLGLPGAWGWRATIGKTNDENGARVDERGPIADLARIEWENWVVTLAYDRDVNSNDYVRAARDALTKELQSRGATVKIFAWPAEYPAANGLDDLISAAGPQFVLSLIAKAKKKAPPKRAATKNIERGLLCNDTANADRLAHAYGDDLAHCEERNGYMIWDGRYWKYDRFIVAEQMAEQTMRSAYVEAANIANSGEREVFVKFVSGSLSKRGLEAMAHLAKKKVRQTPATDFDRDPFLLNCENGTIDLRSGLLREHRKEDLLSKMISIAFDPDAKCPLFLRFIYRIMGLEPDATEEEVERAGRLVNYLQRLFGCAATGKAEKLLAVLYGSGDNGKSTLLAIINKALGEKQYATQLSIDSLMVDPRGAGTSNAVNSDLSDLQGCRFVFSSEVERGQRLALSRVKYLTGLTSVKARRLRENWIEFPQTWKIFLDCNDRPTISSPTDAIWNRVKLLPFDVTLSKEEIDTDLPTKLQAELPGILAWIVEGARDYVAYGLGAAPGEVEASTEQYRASSDRLKEFLEDCCHVNKNGWVSSERLSVAYSIWCMKNGERFPLESKAFAEQLRLKGFTPQKREVLKKETRGWAGLDVPFPAALPSEATASDTKS